MTVVTRVEFPWEKKGGSIPTQLDLTLQRTEQGDAGTNGDLWCSLGFISHSIELPWLNNRQGVSCISAGSYRVNVRVSASHGICLVLQGVPARGDIEIHKANNAIDELKGCISPVTTLTGLGMGDSSGIALAKLEAIVYPMLALKRPVWLTINDVIIPK